MNTEKPTAAERIHHPYSPSKLQSLEACPCYASEFTGNEAAAIGTMQHDVAESGEDDSRLADFKALAVVECLKYVDEIAAGFGSGGVLRIKEEYLPIDDENIRVREDREELVDGKKVKHKVWKSYQGSTAGYLDVGLLSADCKRAAVVDYKYGKVEVEPAPNNLQGLAYMLGLAKRYPGLEECTVYILMPHRDQISFHTFKRTEFPALHLRIKTVVARAVEANKVEDDFSKANPTVSGCLFCSRLGKCPKVAELALKLGKKYAPLKIPESVSTTVFTDPEDAATGIKFSQVIKAWAEAFRAQVTAKSIDSPTFIPKGYTLVPSCRRKVVSAKALGEFAKTFLPVELHNSLEKLFDIAIGNVEKLISTAAKRGEKERTVEEFGTKALAAGLLENGEPFASLRQSKDA